MEELEEELAALEAIYFDDYSLKEGADLDEFPVRIELNLRPTEEDMSPISLNVSFTFSEGYPEDSSALVRVEGSGGLKNSQVQHVSDLLNDAAKSMLGEQMCFALAEQAKEWLNEQVAVEDETLQRQQDDHEKELLEKRDRRNEGKPMIEVGEPVTIENFTEWRDAFEKARADEREKNVVADPRPTGKQLFESGIAKEAV